MKAVSIEDLHPGMTLARTIVNDNMIVVLSENTVLTKPHITDLEVRPFSLHDAYLEMIGHVENAHLHAYSTASERTDALC